MQNSDAFTEKVSIYPRVDVLRACLADYCTSRPNEPRYFVYSDLDVHPMNGISEIFDQFTLERLDETGIVLALREKEADYENSFQILDGKNHKMLQSHNEYIIRRGITYLTSSDCLSRPQQNRIWKFYGDNARFLPIQTKPVNMPPSQFTC